MTTSPILVTGGTGVLGRQVTPLLRAAGQSVRILSRHDHPATEGIEYVTGDVAKNTGLEAAVDGTKIIMHLAGGAKGNEEETRNLARAASRAGVQHLIFISVIAADRVPLGYMRSKLGGEMAVEDSGIPWTTLRAAQFHDLVLKVAQSMGKLPVLPNPGGLRFQPVDSRDVAERLVELALGEPAGMVRDLAGPKVYPLVELVEDYLHTQGKRRAKLPVRIPGQAGRAYRAGENLNLQAQTGERTWEDFLATRFGALH